MQGIIQSGIVSLVLSMTVMASEPPSPQTVGELKSVAKIRNEAQALRTLVSSKIAGDFLGAASSLPEVQGRTLYLDEQTRTYYGHHDLKNVTESTRKKLIEKPVTETFYYTTKYGTPIAYVRMLELYSRFGGGDLAGRRILDFGYGSVGQLRLMAMCGADVVGVEVDSMLRALYGEPGDQGRIDNENGPPGHIKLVHGRFPEISTVVGGQFDLITSKNTLKNGFFHPERPVPKERLIDLGVDDAQFIETIHVALKPGGVFLIYNICPAPSKPGEPYKHWADGRCPFPRVMLESAGFDVVEYNANDDDTTRAMAKALGWDRGEYGMDLANDLFGLFTVSVKRRK